MFDLTKFAHSSTGSQGAAYRVIYKRPFPAAPGLGQVLYNRTYPATVPSWLGQVLYKRTYPATVQSWLGQVMWKRTFPVGLRVAAASAGGQSQSFAIFNNVKVHISGPSADADSNTVTKSIFWDAKNYALQSATLTVETSQQTYSSGASVNAVVNGEQVGADSFGAFDEGPHTPPPYDVTGVLANGANTFSIHYHTALPVLPFAGADAFCNMTLTIVLNYIGTGPTPSGNPFTTGPGLSTYEIYALVGVAVAVVAGLAYAVIR